MQICSKFEYSRAVFPNLFLFKTHLLCLIHICRHFYYVKYIFVGIFTMLRTNLAAPRLKTTVPGVFGHYGAGLNLSKHKF